MTERDADIGRLLDQVVWNRHPEVRQSLDTLARLCQEARAERDAAVQDRTAALAVAVGQRMRVTELERRALAAEAALVELRATLKNIASCPGWINSNALAWQKCRPENQWLDDDPSRCYHGRLVAECEKQCPARIAFAALAASPQPTEGASVPPDAPQRAARGETLQGGNIGQDGAHLA